MNRSVLPISALAFLVAAAALPVVADTTTLAKGVKLDCPAPGSWRFNVSTDVIAPGVETVRVTMKSDVEAPPPRFSLRWFVPQTDVHHLWTSESTHYGIPWSEPMNSELAAWMPLYDFLDANDRSRFAFACSEARRKVVFKAPVSETQMGFNCSFTFFTVPEAPLKAYTVDIRLDSRSVFYGAAIGEAAHWIRFAETHKGALVKGTFRPHSPANDYPLLVGESESERVIGVYQENLVVDAGGADKTVYVLNGANADSITLNLQCAPARIEVYATFGTRVDSPAFKAGLQRFAVPVSGYARIAWGR